MPARTMPSHSERSPLWHRLRCARWQTGWSLESNRRDIGKVMEVLVEGISKKKKSEYFGRSAQNKMVVFPKGNLQFGDLVRVKINDATQTTLIGEVVEG